MDVDIVDANPTFRGGRGPAPAPAASYDIESYTDLDDHHFEYHMRHK